MIGRNHPSIFFLSQQKKRRKQCETMEDEKDREKLFLDYPLGKIRMLKQQNIMKDRIASVLIRKITFQIEKEKKA